MKKTSLPLRLGKESYGTIRIEEAFLKAFIRYFSQYKKQVVE